MFYIINTMKNIRPRLCLRYKKGPDLNLVTQSTICSYAPAKYGIEIQNIIQK